MFLLTVEDGWVWQALLDTEVFLMPAWMEDPSISATGNQEQG